MIASTILFDLRATSIRASSHYAGKIDVIFQIFQNVCYKSHIKLPHKIVELDSQNEHSL